MTVTERERVTVDWNVLELPGVQDVAEQAAYKAYGDFDSYVELEDLKQEALLYAASKKDNIEAAHEGKLGYLQHQLNMDLMNHCDKEVRRKSRPGQGTCNECEGTGMDELYENICKECEGNGVVDKRVPHVSYDELLERARDEEDNGYVTPYIVVETVSQDYTRESVETLLPAIWDESYTYGLPVRDDAPAPDMPKGTSNKATSNNLSAYIADIKVAWDKTPLTIKERRSLFLAFNTTLPGGPWKHREIAYNQDVDRTTITKRIECAVGKLTARLNGGIWYELEDIEA